MALTKIGKEGITGISNSSDATAITIDSSENVGIGTSSPAAVGSYKVLQLRGNATTNGGLIRLETSDGTSGVARFYAGSTSTVLESNSNTNLTFGTNATERMRIDSSGNVMIGETSQINGGNLNLATSASDSVLSFLCRSTTDSHQPKIIMQKSSTNSGNFAATASGELLGTIIFRGVNTSAVSDIGAQISAVQNGTSSSTVPTDLVFNTTENERMRIDSSGQVQVPGNTHSVVGIDESLNVNCFRDGSGNDFGIFVSGNNSAGTHTSMRFYNNINGLIGSITHGATSTAYNTSSDHRIKLNVDYTFDATTRLKQLKPCRFNFIADADTTVDGFLAHEVQSVVPEAITGTHNEVEVWQDGEELPDGVSVGDNKLDEDGNTIPVYQGIDQSKLVPLLVKTIQELEARITALENS